MTTQMQTVLRRLQLGSGVVLLIYLFLHLINHALGIWSLELAGRGLVLALRLWRSTPGTIALYGAATLHFALAMRTIYGRRHWTLPIAEWVRLWAGLSLPLLLIRHAVTTRLASSLYGFEPDYERVVILLLTSGTQGLQLCTARAWMDTRMSRTMVPIASPPVGAPHEARTVGFGRPIAVAVRGRLYPDDAGCRGEERRTRGPRSDTDCASAHPRCLASRSRDLLFVSDRQRVCRRPIAQRP